MLTFTAPGEAYFLPDDSALALAAIIATIQTAKQRIRAIVFDFSHPQILPALQDAFHRGVDLKIIVDHSQEVLPHAAATMHGFVLATSPEIMRIGNSRFGKYLHAKAATFDSQALLEGSTNWTIDAFKQDQTLVILNAPALAVAFETFFDAEWLRISQTEPQYQVPGDVAA